MLNNLSGSEIANELDSRLRDLEKNIAVAREFIKLADESYSELRHKWNLLHEEVRSKSQTMPASPVGLEDQKAKARTRSKAGTKSKVEEQHLKDEPVLPSSVNGSSNREAPVKRIKSPSRSKKQPEISAENTNTVPSEKSQPYRDRGRRRGKANGHN